MGRCIVKAYQKMSSEKRHIDAFIKLLLGNARSPFGDFESFLRIVVCLDENNIKIILKQ